MMPSSKNVSALHIGAHAVTVQAAMFISTQQWFIHQVPQKL